MSSAQFGSVVPGPFDQAEDSARLREENTRLREALEVIAAQQTGEEIGKYYARYADFRLGFDWCIERARAALAHTPERANTEGE